MNIQFIYQTAVDLIERELDIELTLIEKVAIRHHALYSIECGNRGLGVIEDAKIMWRMEYGIDPEIWKERHDDPEFLDYFRKLREASFHP